MPGTNGVPKGGVVDLDVLFQVRRVKLGGREITVKPIDGVGYQKLNAIQKKGPKAASGEDMLVMYEIAGRCLPDVPEAEVMGMTASQIGALIAVAQESLDEVEASIPKRRAPVKRTPAPA